MPPSRFDLKKDQQGDVLEVHGFDLMAQIEAMLRHVREYQPEVQRLRGVLGKGQAITSDKNPVTAVREHVTRLREAAETFSETLDDIETAVPRVSANRPRAQERPRE